MDPSHQEATLGFRRFSEPFGLVRIKPEGLLTEWKNINANRFALSQNAYSIARYRACPSSKPLMLSCDYIRHDQQILLTSGLDMHFAIFPANRPLLALSGLQRVFEGNCLFESLWLNILMRRYCTLLVQNSLKAYHTRDFPFTTRGLSTPFDSFFYDKPFQYFLLDCSTSQGLDITADQLRCDYINHNTERMHCLLPKYVIRNGEKNARFSLYRAVMRKILHFASSREGKPIHCQWPKCKVRCPRCTFKGACMHTPGQPAIDRRRDKGRGSYLLITSEYE